jgi:hypothetical protein
MRHNELGGSTCAAVGAVFGTEHGRDGDGTGNTIHGHDDFGVGIRCDNNGELDEIMRRKVVVRAEQLLVHLPTASTTVRRNSWSMSKECQGKRMDKLTAPVPK